MELNTYFVFFVIFTLLAIFLAEKISLIVVNVVFKKHLKETSRAEKELSRYYEASMIAIIEKDLEAYKGLQEVMNDLYFQIFFRKIMIYSSAFFIIFSPYVLLSKFLFKDLSISLTTTVFSLALLYFMSKMAYNTIYNYVKMKRHKSF